MWFLYILLCDDGSLYTGIAKDVTKRLSVHRTGKGSKYTRMHKPVRIVYTEPLKTKSDALRREYAVKSLSREEKIAQFKLDLQTTH